VPLSVVIVNYRTAALTVRCVESILRARIARAGDIIVVENDSGDAAALRAALPDVVLEVAPDNRGFGAGVNLGMRRATGAYVLVLTPDTYFRGGVDRAITALDADASIGVIGLGLVNPDGSPQYSARRYYALADIVLRRTPLGRVFAARVERHLMTAAWRDDAFDADWVMGTGMIVRRAAFEQIGGMDERFFLYMEDVDLCIRMRLAGARVICMPRVELVHDHQRASAARVLSRAGRAHLHSLRLFHAKYRIPLFAVPDLATIRRHSSA
jgi:N-acetylglucosaminyl-diphospho-decaprenol L-rhamnosyltransferase